MPDEELPIHDGQIVPPFSKEEIDAIYATTTPIKIVRTMSYDWPQLAFRCTVMFLAPDDFSFRFRTEPIGMN